MAQPIHYEDIEVRIETWGPEQLRVRLDSPQGQDAEIFRAPFGVDELTPLLDTLEAHLRGEGPPAGDRHVRAEIPPLPSDPATLGTTLFRSFLPGKLARHMATALARPGRRQAHGIRIRLLFDLREPGLASLVALPWEFLCNPDTGDFLALDPHTPVVRSIDVPRAEGGRPGPPPLRVLLAAALPDGAPRLDLDGERRAIQQACGGRERLEVERIDHPTPEELRWRLRKGEHQVLHFMGHGDFGDEGGRLLLADAAGPRPVAGRILATVLRQCPALRLVMLNACDTGQLPRRQGLDPFSGVATALVDGGLPAVVGMQFPISDGAAIRFSKTFYRHLVAGDPVDAAVAGGRLTLFTEEQTRPEWATPTLYLRAPNGQLLDPAPSTGEPASGPAGRREELPSGPGGPPEDFGPASGRRPAGEARPVPRAPRRRRATRLLAPAAVLLVALLLAGLWMIRSPGGDRVGDPRSLLPGHLANPPGCPPPPQVDIPLERIEAGSFRMGSAEGEPDEAPVRTLKVDEPFCLGLFEVTQAEWEAVMGEGTNPSRLAGPRRPVNAVSYHRVLDFIDRLNRQARGHPFRLPTETEWEYAARAGTRSAYSFGDDPGELPRHGNCLSPGELQDGHEYLAQVGSFAPNPWGLYDVHGNVWEWVATSYRAYPGGTLEEPPPANADRVVIRGGAYGAAPENCRSARRNSAAAASRQQRIGFRLARDLAGAPARSGP